MAYAKGTDVSVAKTQAEIQGVITRYGAESFMFGASQTHAQIAFDAKNRRVRFLLPLPAKNEKRFTHGGRYNHLRSDAQALAAWEQACRERWRGLALCIKAKLEAVDAGIATFEEEFMAHIVLPNGETVAEHVLPKIADAYRQNIMVPLIEGPKPPSAPNPDGDLMRAEGGEDGR